MAYWSAEMVFTDVFKQAGDWIPQLAISSPWDTGEAFAGFTADGYPLLHPGQAAATLTCREIDGHYPAGRYVCFYDGQGTIEFGFDARISSQSPGRADLDVVPSAAGILVRITASDPSDPIRNIRIIMPGFEATYATQPFTPEFLERWSRFKALRFMDWQRTNDSPVKSFSEIAGPGWFSEGSSKGVSVETMVDVANALHADPWFCMPHQATDDFVERFATVVRDRLDPGSKVYIEYSNEVWNGQFAQFHYAKEQGIALGLGTGYDALYRFYSQRSVQIFRIWERVFGGTGRLVRVLGSQLGVPAIGEAIMDWQSAYLEADVFAIAAYIWADLGHPDTANQVAQMTVPEVLQACETGIELTMDYLSTNIANATARGLPVVAYEGGQHLVGYWGAQNNVALSELFMATNRDPRLKDVYARYLDAWRRTGGTLFMHYASTAPYSKWGSWGTLEWCDQETSPKYEALVEFVEANPRWW